MKKRSFQQAHVYRQMAVSRIDGAIRAALPEADVAVETEERFNPNHDPQPREHFTLTAKTSGEGKVVIEGDDPAYRLHVVLTGVRWDVYQSVERSLRALGAIGDECARYRLQNALAALDIERADVARELLALFVEGRGDKIDYGDPKLAEVERGIRVLVAEDAKRAIDDVVDTWSLDEQRRGPKHEKLRGSWLRIDRTRVLMYGFDETTGQHQKRSYAIDPDTLAWKDDRLAIYPADEHDHELSVTLVRRGDGGFDAEVRGYDVFPWGGEYSVTRL